MHTHYTLTHIKKIHKKLKKHMGWFVGSNRRRGLSWQEQVLESASIPPAPLMVFFGLVILLIFLANYGDYKLQMERTKLGAKLFVVLLPLLLMLLLCLLMVTWRFLTRCSSTSSVARSMSSSNEGGSPLVMLFWVVLLLVMVYYQSYFQASWLRLF
ncbi:hypothetical protein LIER_43342 [Lithospermum erythrorhizon]|uniref:Transmembrane protein n=1 Tax=Lithospermum erythrorhizon TaxID=34254 RepID=A0AAV3PY62_LITER